MVASALAVSVFANRLVSVSVVISVIVVPKKNVMSRAVGVPPVIVR